jgi:hypothetical protein
MMKKLMYLMVANKTPDSEVVAPKGAAASQDSTDKNMNKEDEESHDDHSHEGHSHD